MYALFSETTTLTMVVSTITILILAAFMVAFIFLYQKKRFRHRSQLREMQEEYDKTLLQSTVAIKDQTMEEIGKEIHASCGVLASLINFNLQEILPQSPDQLKDILLSTKALTKQLLAELRAISVKLNTELLTHTGLSKAVEGEVRRLEKAGLNGRYLPVFVQKGDEFRLVQQDEIILFRLCQEVLNNTIRYANARNISVCIDFRANSMHLEFRDDGIGFDVEKALEQSAAKESTGLLNMKKRAKLINANISIESQPGSGTCVVIDVPK